MLLLTIIVTILIVSVKIIVIYINNFKYWKKRNVPHLETKSIFGNYGEHITLKKTSGIVADEICNVFPDEPYIGTFYGTEPALIVKDPLLLKDILTKDFYYFNAREVSKYTDRELSTQNLFFTYGDRWKVLRQNLTPLFTSKKMRNMYHLIETCSNKLTTMLERDTSSSTEVDIQSSIARYTMDCIGACGFGINTNTMEDGESNNQFSVIGKKILEANSSRALKFIGRAIWPFMFYLLRFEIFPKQVQDFFGKVSIGIFEERHYKPSSRNDFIDLILSLTTNKYIVGEPISNMKTGERIKIKLPADNDMLVSQCITFFAAGYETTAATMSFTLYELAKNKHAQETAIQEVDEFLKKYNNSFGYDNLNELNYLEACISEALRLYPVLGLVTREVYENYKLSTGLYLNKGLRIHIPVYHIHRNPLYFTEPDTFRAERFLGEEKAKIGQYTYMPFGEGPRICIGARFAKMQMLTGLVTIFKNYSLEMAEDTPHKLELDSRSFVTQPSDGIRLRLEPRSKRNNKCT